MAPLCSGASWIWMQSLQAVHRIVDSSAETERGQRRVRLGSTCTALPLGPAIHPRVRPQNQIVQTVTVDKGRVDSAPHITGC
jgi:hypothetical protein